MTVDEDGANDIAEEGGSRAERPAKKRGGRATKYRKAPQAPKRFKSSYIIFSMAKQEELKKEGVLIGGSGKVTSTSKKIADLWRNLDAEERHKWDEAAKKDKIRYMAEKSLYTGPWQIPTKRAKKDPAAPKRPMSAFLFFSQGLRQKVRESNPEMKNTDVSRALGELWKNASEEEKKPHVDREAKERAQYNKDMAVWREKKAEEDKLERERREAIAAEAVKNGLIPGAHPLLLPPVGMMQPMGMSSNMMPSYPPMGGMPQVQQDAAAGGPVQDGSAEQSQEGQNQHQQMTSSQGYYYAPPMYYPYGYPPMPMQGMPIQEQQQQQQQPQQQQPQQEEEQQSQGGETGSTSV